MNETGTTIRLVDLIGGSDAWGHEQGREIHGKLLKIVEARPAVLVFRVSLDGLQRTDASFPRESVVELARRYRGRRGICLVDVEDPDLLDNWDAAAQRLLQPLFVWQLDGKHRLIGPPPAKGNVEMLEHVMSVPTTTASKASKSLHLKVNNASMKLRQLNDAGYILRREESASSGGVEYSYFRIG